MALWHKYSKEQLEEMVKNSYSYTSVAQKIGYKKDSGSANKAVKEMLAYHNIDYSHFTGQGWNKDNFDYGRFQYGVKLKETLQPLIALRGHKCEKCGSETWFDQPITLEVHHIDGDNLNNVLENLQILCPNCHSYTENWRGKNIPKTNTTYISDEDFAEALKNSKNIRQALISLGLTAAGANYTRANELIVKFQITHLLK